MSDPKNLQLIKVFSCIDRSASNPIEKKYKVCIVYKDRETGEKDFKIIESPSIDFYATKNIQSNYKRYIKLNETNKYEIKYTNLLDEALIQFHDKLYGTDLFNTYRYLKTSESRYDNAEAKSMLLKLYSFFETDIDLEEFYISEFLKENPYDKQKNSLSKAYFDIEVDVRHDSPFPEEEAKCPINIITILFEPQNEVYTLILYDEENEQLINFKKNIETYKNKITERFNKENKSNLKFNIEFYGKTPIYDETGLYNPSAEKALLKRFFYLINEVYKPDFLMAWNMKFDILTILNRLNLHINVDGLYNYASKYVVPKVFNKEGLDKCFYRIDRKNSIPNVREDYFLSSSWGTYIDQLKLYADLRKAFTKKDSYSLNSIGEDELNIHKDEFPEGVSNHQEFPFKAYEEFVNYNIQDVIIQWKIETKNNDIDLFYLMSLMCQTNYHRVTKETISSKNMFRYFCHQHESVIGNNINTFKEEKPENNLNFNDDDSVVKGGYVLSPQLIDNVGVDIYGSKSQYLHKHTIDFDLKTLYPSIFITFDIDLPTQLAELEMEGYEIEKFLESLATRNFVKLAEDIYNYPKLNTILNDNEIIKLITERSI